MRKLNEFYIFSQKGIQLRLLVHLNWKFDMKEGSRKTIDPTMMMLATLFRWGNAKYEHRFPPRDYYQHCRQRQRNFGITF